MHVPGDDREARARVSFVGVWPDLTSYATAPRPPDQRFARANQVPNVRMLAVCDFRCGRALNHSRGMPAWRTLYRHSPQHIRTLPFGAPLRNPQRHNHFAEVRGSPPEPDRLQASQPKRISAGESLAIQPPPSSPPPHRPWQSHSCAPAPPAAPAAECESDRPVETHAACCG